jgi:hypothetical protein
MAFIFEKIGSLENEQCLILGVREPLIYPFIDSGTPWRQIIIGYYFSFCGTGSGNSTCVNESFLGRSTNSELAGFWGIKDSGRYYPYQTGVFAGRAAPTGSLSVGNEVYFIPSSEKMAINHDQGFSDRVMISVNRTGVNSQALNGIGINTAANSIATSNYCAYYAQRFIAEPNSDSKYSLYFYDSSTINIPAPYNLTGIRNRALNNTTWTLRQTGMLTSNMTAAGDFVPLPNCLFVYMPLTQNRMRIHQLLVELVD